MPTFTPAPDLVRTARTRARVGAPPRRGAGDRRAPRRLPEEQLRDQRLNAARSSSQSPQAAVATARRALAEVRDAAARMSDLS